MRKTRKFDTIEKECEWCHNKFEVTWKIDIKNGNYYTILKANKV